MGALRTRHRYRLDRLGSVIRWPLLRGHVEEGFVVFFPFES